MGGLAAAFLAYADKWSASAIESDWDGYCSESHAIIEALTQRIIRENRDLYPLAERENARPETAGLTHICVAAWTCGERQRSFKWS